MKFVRLLATAGLAGSTSLASAQVTTSWSQIHDAPPGQTDTLTDLAVGASGVVAVTGRSFNTTSGFPPPPPTGDFETVAYDATGTFLWRARFDGPLAGDDVAFAIASTPDGGFVVAGQSGGYSSSTYVTRQSVVKYAANGTQQWANSYGSTGPNTARALIVLPTGEIYVGGADGGTSGSGDLCVRKLDASGNELWLATHDGAAGASDYVVGLALAPNGDVVAAGSTTTASSGTTDFALMRVSASGTVLWAREVDGGANGSDAAFAVAVDAGGNAYAVGQMITGTSGNDQAIRAYDAAGNLLWADVRDGSAHAADAFRRVGVDPYGRVVALGSRTETAAGTDFSVAVYAANGTPSWSHLWNGAANLDDTARGLAIDAVGNVYAVGFSNVSTTPATTAEGRVVAYEPNGAQRFAFAFGNGTNSERFIDVESGPGLALFVGGYHDQGVPNGLDFLTVRLERTSTAFCFGDGTGTACPCGNVNLVSLASGCLNSLGTGGTLFDTGSASTSDDSLVLHGSNMPSGPCLYFQGTAQLGGGGGVTFGDGLRCAGGVILRLGIRTNVGGASEFPGAGQPAISTTGLVTAPTTRTYQLWYRDSAAFCTSATFDLTNGVSVAWGP